MICSLRTAISHLRDLLETETDAYFIVTSRYSKGECLAVIPFSITAYPLLHVHGKHVGKLFDVSSQLLKHKLTELPTISAREYKVMYVVPELGEALLIWYIGYLTAKKIETEPLEALMTYGVPQSLLDLRRHMLSESLLLRGSIESAITPEVARKYSRIVRQYLRKYARLVKANNL